MEVVSAVLTNAVVIGGAGAAAVRMLQLGAGIYFGKKAISTDGERAERAHELARVLMNRRRLKHRRK